MEPEIHLWADRLNEARGRSRWNETRRQYLYPALCGVHVGWNELTRRPDTFIPSKQPTCMGCILVRFQQKAEEQDG
jgi:hypothetical protein